MLDIFTKLIDCLLPPHSSVLKLRREKVENFNRLFRPQIYKDTLVLSDYSSELIKLAIKANKFHKDNHASKLLATLLNKWLGTLSKKPTILIPIPLSKQREKERGYNQVVRILQNLERRDNILILNLLRKIKDTTPQTKLNRQQRLHNMENVFVFDKPDTDLQSYRVILIDDVITTGTTISSAYKVLKGNLPEGTEILCLALAH